MDPPYETDFAEKSAEKIIQYGLLEDDGIIIIETDNKEKIIENTNDQLLEIYDIRKYGRVNLLFLKRKG